ncbi:ABC transporter ATP-binding protein [Marinactinospora thermotolerans]|uniref:ATP-binding cassette, subfamily B n=1 Tax=Marinactinospora thermotolerans DSM 45154 TaxID=1122192 RepID=A0A1T4NJU1_9ACTN|nr:ABC transporter ATP-binding protein [Marinactinospora thermotolerans]SJZ79540.1 ATP-binding cassette, subfamily B [Marinactinospora thermotolerans DSM 45154]
MIRAFLHAIGPEHARPVRTRLLLTALVCALQGVLFALLVPVVTTLLGEGPAAAAPWLIVLLVVTVLYALLRSVSLYLNFELGGRVSRALHHRLGAHVARLPLGWFTGARLGELNRMATDGVSRAMQVPVHILPPLADAVVTPAVAVLALLVYDWRIGVAAAVCALPLWAAFHHAGRAVGRNEAARDTVADEAAGRVLEYARAQPVLRAFGRTTRGHARLDEALRAEHAAVRRLLLAGIPALTGYALVLRVAFGALVFLAVHLALGGTPDGPLAVALLVLVVRFVHPLSNAADLGAALRMAAAGLARINAVLDLRPLPEPRQPQTPRDAGVEFDDVRFRYTDEGPDVLDGVTFRAAPGTVTALVGPSGSGKSTVARLLARFHDPRQGRVLIGGVDTRDLGSEEVSRQVAMVFQDVYLFDATIADNIRVAAPQATAQDLERAARLSGLDEVVATLPDGWDTRVGEGGTALSGGQRQRVSIARALLKDASIVVLDEATAALDAENEAIVSATVAELARERTLIVIAHRPATVRAADHVVFLDAGRVVEQGGHDELLAADGHYTGFLRARERALGWRLSAGPA